MSERYSEPTPWGELVLQLRDDPAPSAALILEGMFLMDSGSADSERALAQLAGEALRRARAAAPNARRGRRGRSAHRGRARPRLARPACAR